jgi:hypothetical protein
MEDGRWNHAGNYTVQGPESICMYVVTVRTGRHCWDLGPSLVKSASAGWNLTFGFRDIPDSSLQSALFTGHQSDV